MKKLSVILSFFIGMHFALAQDFYSLTSPDRIDPDGQDLYRTLQLTPGDMSLDREWDPLYYGDFDPGIPPEGDYMAQAVFSPDGSTIYLTNRFTDMLTVYDWATMQVIANVPTGDYPSCIAATEENIIVGCQFSDHVFIYSALDYVLVDSLPTGEQPCRIHVSPDGESVYVACDIDDACTVIDLKTMTVSQTIDNFIVYLQTVSWSTQSARNWAKYSDFLVSPEGDYLIAHNGESEVQVFDIASGMVSQTVSSTSPRALAFSGDNNYLVCAANPGSVATVHRISWPGLVIDATVEVPGHNLATSEVVVDAIGLKAYVGTGNNTSTLVRFLTSDYVQFSNTYTAFWLGVTYDHQYVVSGQNRFSIIDFVSETMTDQYPGLNQSWGAVSPVDYHVFSYDPLLYEGAYFFDISDPYNINFRGSTLSGDEPEGDAPYRVAINDWHGYIITVDNLSYSSNVLDYYTGDVVAVFDLGESCYDVVVKGIYAVCGGYNNNTVKVIDLDNLEVVAEVTTGQRPMELTAHPFESIVYAANIKSNSISVIEIDGANSQVVATIPCGIIGVYIPFFGIRSGVEVSPDGQYLLVAASFDDQVKVIDTESNQIVKSLDVGDFPLAIGFSIQDDVACVTNLFDDSFSLIQLDGVNSEVIGTYPCNGQYPVDVEYYAVDNEFWLCNYYNGNVTKFDALDGSYKGQVNMEAYGGAWSLEFYDEKPVYLTAGSETYGPAVIYQDSIFELPASASYMDLGALDFGYYAAVTIPGPDWVSLIELDWLEAVHFPPQGNVPEVNIYPNPFSENLIISSEEDIRTIKVYDVTGRVFIYKEVEGNRVLLVERGLPPGAYFVECGLANGEITVEKVLKLE